MRSQGRQLHVYVSTEYPSISQTFVETEMAGIAGRGAEVLAYSLKSGPTALAASASHLTKPVSRLGLLAWAPLGALLLAYACLRGLSCSVRSITRLLYAASHAVRLAIHLRPHRVQGQSLVLHAHFLDRPADVVALSSLLLRGSRRVVTVHAGDARNKTDRRLRAWRLRAFDLYLCASEYVREGLVADRADIPAAVVYCGVDVARIRSQISYRSHKDCLRFVTVARLIPVKNHEYAYKMLTALAAQGLLVEWDVVGDGPLQLTLEAYKREANFPIRLHGALPHAAALAVLTSADACILPSSLVPPGPDGLPVALIEAMAAGVLVVSTPVGGIPELVRDGATGVLGAIDDPASCAKKFLVLHGDLAAWRATVERGYEHVMNSFDVKVTSGAICAAIDSLFQPRTGDQCDFV